MVGIELIMQEMPPDGSRCIECNELIFGKMFQLFAFEVGNDPTPTRFKYCENCNKEDEINE